MRTVYGHRRCQRPLLSHCTGPVPEAHVCGETMDVSVQREVNAESWRQRDRVASQTQLCSLLMGTGRLCPFPLLREALEPE